MKYGYILIIILIIIIFFKHLLVNRLCVKHLLRRLSSKTPFSETHATLMTYLTTGALSASLPRCDLTSLCSGTGSKLRQGVPSQVNLELGLRNSGSDQLFSWV